MQKRFEGVEYRVGVSGGSLLECVALGLRPDELLEAADCFGVFGQVSVGPLYSFFVVPELDGGQPVGHCCPGRVAALSSAALASSALVAW
ncbi:hypothetical protein [Streptomyces bauhiniae]|uniref:hypothetical protein n=1 Tax=Streptomyces bauhiniae TaxID=2340725 RepID=UPI001EF31799|nr:hypothetical protein [Streptomyces bauhiniae]